MGRNGIREIASWTIELTPEDTEYLHGQEQARRIAVFGLARIAEQISAPSTAEVDGLVEQIEDLCTGPQGRSFRGIYSRELQGDRPHRVDALNLMWNPAGTMGGFGVNRAWDGALANVRNVAIGSEYRKTHGWFAGRYSFNEGLYIDRESGNPIITKELWRPRSEKMSGGILSANKPASSEEIASTSRLLRRYAAMESREAATNATPVYLEIGYGLDPVALRGNRTYKDKGYVGIDRAVGDFEHPTNNYPAAVRSEAARFTDIVASERAGEHIAFEVGDAKHIELPDGSVREIFMSNVLNAPLDEQTRGGILREAARLLEPNGSLVARVNWHQDEWPEDVFIAALSQTGFSTWRTVTAEDVEYSRLDTIYGKPAQVPAPDGYYVIADART